jgi:murein DD-endopeptidase MepM/ murein hydrolase activator NlpD
MYISRFTLICIALLLTKPSLSLGQTIDIIPKSVVQGEPFMVQVSNIPLSQIQSLFLDTKKLSVFLYNNKPTALVGIDLNKKIGTYEIKAVLINGSTATNSVQIIERKKIQAELGIPESLGGNSATNTARVVSTLELENKQLASIYTGLKAFWSKPFRYPIANPVVTDTYGYSRLTNGSTITHKGTDFRAKTPLPVLAMNRGVVRIAKKFTVYGNTVVIDHGLGVQTMYMHLSKIRVNVGELVLPGQVLGLSGSTGYAEAPHLHLSIRINNISIDPEKFLSLFK